jgi:signal peptidase
MRHVVVTPAPADRATRGLVGRVVALAAWGTFGFGVAFGTFVVAGRPLGFESLAVLSGSMEPTLRVGDLVIDRRLHPIDIHVGDIVTFRDPDDHSRLLTHRVFRFRTRGAKAYVVTKGDANHSVERWTLPLDGTLGRVQVRVPKVGYGLTWAGGRFGRLALLVVPALLLALLELKRLWLPRRLGQNA